MSSSRSVRSYCHVVSLKSLFHIHTLSFYDCTCLHCNKSMLSRCFHYFKHFNKLAFQRYSKLHRAFKTKSCEKYEKIKKSIGAFIFFSHSLSRSLCHLAAACTIDQFEIAAPQLCTAYVLKSKHPICERSCWCDLSDLWTFPTKDFDWTPRVISEPSELVGSLNAADDVTRLQSHLLFGMWASRACCCDRRTVLKY